MYLKNNTKVTGLKPNLKKILIDLNLCSVGLGLELTHVLYWILKAGDVAFYITFFTAPSKISSTLTLKVLLKSAF